MLGVVVDEAGSYLPHANYIGQRAANAFGKLSRVSASSWGIRYPALKFLYAGTYRAVLTYAAEVWYNSASRFTVRRALLRTQRPALTLLTKAYRSVSTAALPVLAGVLPADLDVQLVGRLARERAGLLPRERRRRKKELLQDVLTQWQKRWEESTDGRELYCFFPDVAERIEQKWVEPDYATSQILTGHGAFRSRLHAMALSDTSECHCGLADETRDHVLWKCPLYDEERSALLEQCERNVAGPIWHADLVNNSDAFQRLKEFAHKWQKKRKLLE